jgi:hypothetical protein
MSIGNFTAAPESGNVYVTDFTFVDLLTSNNKIVKRVWDLGDQNYKYNDHTITHSYNYPGNYTVSLTTTDVFGNSFYSYKNINVDYAYRDALEFLSIPNDYANPGMLTDTTFKIGVTSAQINAPIILDLFAINSKSVPYDQVPIKWRFLTPTWKFLDKNKNFVTSLSVTTTPIYVNNKVAAVSGEAEFYFIDDQSVGTPGVDCPLLLTVTLQTSGFINPLDSLVYSYPSYANNESVRLGLIWQINNVLPDYLKITENYISDIYPYKWENVKIPFIVTCHSSRRSFFPGAGPSESGILFSYPATNSLGSISSVEIKLHNNLNYIVDEAPLYFQAIDQNSSSKGGYIFSTITPTLSTSSTYIQASTTAFFNLENYTDKFPYPTGYVPNPFVWVSNPAKNTLNKVTLEPYPRNCLAIEDYKNRGLLIQGYVKAVDVPKIESVTTFNYAMSGFSGIYGMAIDPRDYSLIATDSELNRIYRFSDSGAILGSAELSSITGQSQISGGSTPSNITLDKDYNIYVSLFNSISVLKFDQYFNLLYSLAPSGYNMTEVPTNFTAPDAVFDNGADFYLKPPAVETDRENNLWTTYAFPLCSLLIKYNSSGSLVKFIPLENYSVPVSLAITPENNVWVANSVNVIPNAGNLQLYSSNGTLLSTISGIAHPSYIAVDRNNNLWFTYGVRNIGMIEPLSGIATAWNLSKEGLFNIIELSGTSMRQASGTTVQEYEDDEELGGLAIDVYNRVWVIDSYTNFVYTFSAQNNFIQNPLQKAKIYPDGDVGYFVDLDEAFTYTLTGEGFKSAQANGDWTGNKWYQKYYNPGSLSAIPLSGISSSFTIKPFVNTAQIYRVNEGFNNSEYIKSLALPKTLNNNPNLFDNFFGAAVGNSVLSAYEDLGQKVYERIANFPLNHADIDTCNIDQLLSYAKEMDVPAFVYDLTLPAEIKKYLDIASISRNHLWGIKSPQPLFLESIGRRLDTRTDYVTAGTKIYLQSKSDSKYTLHTVQQLSSLIVYPLSSFTGGYEFATPILTNYFFYEFTPVYSNNFIENLIDWNNPNTTLNPYFSSVDDWVGNSGNIETVFNFLLTKYLLVK